MEINEIFYSLQGEGVLTGEPMVFVRLQGCNKRCTWCDTKRSQKIGKGLKSLTSLQIADEVRMFGGTNLKWVCITGGEPLVSDELEGLTLELRRRGYFIEVETNGTLPIPNWYHSVDSWVADYKCPSSKVQSSEEWFDMRPQDQVKFVVSNQEDLNATTKMLAKHKKTSTVKIVSPGFTKLEIDYSWARKVAEYCKGMNVRYSLQLHKVLWGLQEGV